MEPNAKLHVVVRSDLSPAQQAVQGLHAYREFVSLHPEIDREWYTRSNHLAFLSVPSEASLAKLKEAAESMGFRVAAFHEPDPTAS